MELQAANALKLELQEFLGDQIAQELVARLHELSKQELTELRETFASLIPFLQQTNGTPVM